MANENNQLYNDSHKINLSTNLEFKKLIIGGLDGMITSTLMLSGGHDLVKSLYEDLVANHEFINKYSGEIGTFAAEYVVPAIGGLVVLYATYKAVTEQWKGNHLEDHLNLKIDSKIDKVKNKGE